MVRWLMLIAWSLVAVGTAGAQINHPYNEVGIYTVEHPDGVAETEIDAPAEVMVDCYIVLTNPYNEALGRPIATVGGFEFNLTMPDGVYLLSIMFLPPSVGWPTGPDYLIGCEAPVTDGACTLANLTLMSATGGPDLLYLQPVQFAPQSIPGQMVFTDFDDDFSMHVMHPVSGSHDVPVFALNWEGELPFGETVPARAESFGTVKALYR